MTRRILFPVLRVAVLALAALYAVGGTSPSNVTRAHAATGPAGPNTAVGAGGPVKVTVLPTVGVQNGQALAIHAEAPSGTAIYEIKAHLCQHGANITSTWDFGWEGKNCTSVAVGAGDFEQTVAIGTGAQTGDLGFKAGTGTAHWTDDRSFPHTITCGQGAPCDLVVQLQITNATAFYTAPLCYGTGCGPEPTGGAAAPPAKTTTTTAPAPKHSTKATPAVGADGLPIATTTTTTGPAADAAKPSGANPKVEEPKDSTRGTRVLVGGLVGAAGGARLVQISTRVRRRLGRGT